MQRLLPRCVCLLVDASNFAALRESEQAEFANVVVSCNCDFGKQSMLQCSSGSVPHHAKHTLTMANYRYQY